MLNPTIFLALCTLLIWSPLAFGSVHVWAYTLVGLITVLVVIGTLQVLYGLYQMLSPNPSLLWFQKTVLDYV
jgi:predicted phage tail protein